MAKKKKVEEVEQEQVAEVLDQVEASEGTVKRPELTGELKKQKPQYEQPGTNNQSRKDIGLEMENE